MEQQSTDPGQDVIRIIQTQIGIFTRNLEKLIEEAKDIDDINDTLKASSAKEIFKDINEIYAIYRSIKDIIPRIERLEANWVGLTQTDPTKLEGFHRFKADKGDWNKLIIEGNACLMKLEKQYQEYLDLHKTKVQAKQEYMKLSDDIMSYGISSPPRTSQHQVVKQEVLTPTQQQTFVTPMPMQVPPMYPAPNTIGAPQYPVYQQPFVPMDISLPNLELPTFDGNFVQFDSFKQRFDSMIGSRPIADIHKMQYLIGAVKGEAAKLIRHLACTAENYSGAMKTLVDHYGDPIRARHSLSRQMQNLPSVAVGKNMAEIEEFWTLTFSTFHMLKNVQPECDNVSNAENIAAKLPYQYVQKLLKLERTRQRQLIASELLEELRQFIQDDVIATTVFKINQQAESKLTTMSVQNVAHSKQHGHGRNNHHHQKNSTRRPCAFCSEDHRHGDCTVYITVDDRKKRTIELKLCWKCLKGNHQSKDCRNSKVTCYHCKKEHNTAFCNQRDKGSSSSSPQGSRDNNQSSGQRKPGNVSSGNSSNGNKGRQQGQHQANQRRVQFNNTAVAQSEEYEDSQPQENGVNFTFTTASYPDMPSSVIEDDEMSTAVIEEVAPIKDAVHDNSLPVAMMVARVIVDGSNGEVNATVFFDNGSDRSYISQQFAEQLELEPLDTKRLHIQTFADSTLKTLDTERFIVTFHIKDKKIPLPLTKVERIARSINTGQFTEENITSLLQDEDAVLPRGSAVPDILIGLDVMNQILGDTTSRTLPNGTTLHYTDVGIIITGREGATAEQQLVEQEPIAAADDYYYLSSTYATGKGILSVDPVLEQEALHALIEKFWSLQSSGIFGNPRTTDEEVAAKFFETTTTREADGRYQCRWPYKENKDQLPDNRNLAYHRVQNTLNKLRKDPELYRKYNDIIEDQMKRQFIERVEDESTDQTVHYLSHHPIIKCSSKTTKVRIVYDASARASRQSPSLNDVLYTGESLLPQLLGVLLRIRKPAILISSDIEKAFLMLSLHPADRDACRFFWQPPDSERMETYRFLRVPFGVKTSPYLLNATIRKHLLLTNTPVSLSMLRNIYVDNCFYGTDSVDEGMKFYRQSKDIFAEAQMNLTQFFSNNEDLDSRIASLEGKPREVSKEQKILGVQWNVETDMLSVGIPKPIGQQPTKRRILQHIAAAYDPYGLLAPVILKGKLFFQRLWKRSANWDEQLTDEEIKEWRDIENSICGNPVSVRRTYFTSPTNKDHQLELHLFGDASDAAYGTVAYIRRIGPDGIKISFVTAKCKVAPLRKALTIPQMELLAIDRCAHLAHNLRTELDLQFKKIYIWSDSLCSLDQLSSNKAGSVYGRNRLRSINQIMPDACFSHIPGKLNPADVLSRSCSLEDLRNNGLWWNGPSFLQEEKLPIRESSIQKAITAMCITDEEHSSKETVLNLEPTRFSSWTRMVNVVKRIFRLFGNSAEVSATKANQAIIRLAQQIHPPDDNTVNNLHLHQEEGIWYFDGRVRQKKVPFMPAHHIGKLLVMAIHKRHMHCSPMQTLAKLRTEVWIPKGLSFIRKTIKECHLCQLILAKPTRQPDFPNLPNFRITWTKPFTYVGMDYAGPINALSNSETKKFWILIFTCLTSRYTVVELVPTMDAICLLATLRRICAQYGTPKEIRTDNGTQFVMLSAVTREAQKQLHVSSEHAELPTFRHISALSPWSGGTYERMVALVKNCLMRSGATKRLLTEEDLRTMIKEAESIINDRPLTYVNNDDILPLRPVDFVFPNKRHAELLKLEEHLDTTTLPTTQAHLLQDWIQTSTLTEYFIRRWKEEYVQMLQTRNQIEHRQNKHAKRELPKVGDVVIFEDEGKKKINWPLARIMEVGERAAKLFCGRTKRIIERPHRKIYQLEIQEEAELEMSGEQKSEPSSAIDKGEQPIATRTRGRRGISASTLLTTSITCFAMMVMLPTTTAVPISTPNHLPPENVHLNYSRALTVLQSQAKSLTDTFHYMVDLITILCCVITISALLQTICTILHCSNKIINATSALLKLFCGAVSRSYRFVKRRTIRWRRPTTIVLLCGLVCKNTIFACNSFSHLTAREKACLQEENATVCHINTISMEAVRANGSTACLMIYSHDDEKTPLTTLKITAEALVTHCQKRTIFYSRDFKLTHEYVKRCDSAGSCSIERCGSLKFDEDLPELTQEAKNHPGYTRCESGCGGWHCSCFYWDPSCLFYRYYAVPSSNTIYEVFTCPVWIPKLRVNIEMGDLRMTTELAPGVKFIIPSTNISVTAIGFSSTSLLVHGATYISAYEPTSLSAHWTALTHNPHAPPGAPTKGQVGEFQCSDRKAAENFDCQFDADMCKCAAHATQVNCQCHWQEMKEYEQRQKLPISGYHHSVITVNDKVTVNAIEDTLIQLNVEIRNASVTRFTHVQRCVAKQIGEIYGCHSCFSGGRAKLSCQSTKEMKGLLHCGTIDTSIDCGPSGVESEIAISSDDDSVEWNCTLDCGQRTWIVIQGELETISLFSKNSTAYFSSAYSKIIETSLGLGNLVDGLRNFVFSSFVGPVIIAFSVIIVYCLLLILRSYLSKFLALRRRQARIAQRNYYY